MNLQEHLSQEGRFLCLSAKGEWNQDERDELKKFYEVSGDRDVYSSAKRNQMLPLVANALVSVKPKKLNSHWAALLKGNQSRVETLVETLEEITIRLSAQGCPHAAVEAGGVMLGTALPTQAYCSGDIDLLVKKEHWSAVKNIYEEAGFTSKDRRDRPTTRIEYCKTSDKSEQWLEVGFAPFDRMWVPLNYNDRCAQWLSRAVPSKKFPYISVLNPNDALVFVAFHTSLHSYIRAPGLRLQVDVDRIVRDCSIDWDEFVREVRLTGIQTRVYVSLRMAKELLESPIPMKVLEKLAPTQVRCRAIFSLLQKNGVIIDGKPKLGRSQSILLDILISEKSPPAWLWQLVFPDRKWMLSHFDREEEGMASWQLHRKRILALASRWKPE